eukprot:Nitzschia sp. Nitz4//scaffold80_size88189//1092//2891//NITZ4_005076-RA/size88189-processed-gene-0.9-mRNA-1//1//CDS//3329558597//6743//frame0
MNTRTPSNTYNRKIVKNGRDLDDKPIREPIDSGNRIPLRPMVGKFNVFVNGRNQRLKAWQTNSFLNRSKQSLTARDYQEIEEECEVQSTAPVPSAFGSMQDGSVTNRSSRLNLEKGKPILVRQKAQVMNRPSMAQADWDVGSVFSSTSINASKEEESILGAPEQNLNWDNASLGAISEISHLTGDSMSLREKQSDFSMSRAMYIHPFYDTECDEESDGGEVHYDQQRSRSHGLHDLSNFDDTMNSALSSKSMTMPPVLRQFVASMTTTNEENEANILSLDDARVVVNEVLRNSKTDFVQVSGWDLRDIDDDYNSIVDVHENRVRVYSDSDMILESRRRRSCDFHERRSPDKVAVATAGGEDYVETSDVSESRARSQSETFNRDGVHTELLTIRPRCISDDWKNLGSNRAALSPPKTTPERTSGGRIQLGPVRIPHLRRARSVSADSHPLLEHHHKQEANRTDSLLDMVDDRQCLEDYEESRDTSSKPRATIFPKLGKSLSSSRIGSSLAETASRVSATTKRIAQPFARNQMQRLPSATAVSAAKQLASALRPPSASMAGARVSSMHDYYWSTGDENDEGSECGEDVLWSLSAESFEDIL